MAQECGDYPLSTSQARSIAGRSHGRLRCSACGSQHSTAIQRHDLAVGGAGTSGRLAGEVHSGARAVCAVVVALTLGQHLVGGAGHWLGRLHGGAGSLEGIQLREG